MIFIFVSCSNKIIDEFRGVYERVLRQRSETGSCKEEVLPWHLGIQPAVTTLEAITNCHRKAID